jgi:hypothetical protein
MHQIIRAVAFVAILLHCGCEPAEENMVRQTVGYRPVYGPREAVEIALTDPAPVKHPGKIYEYGQYLFVNELSKGIHVFDNSDPVDPEPVAFLKIIGNSDMAIRNNILYANHMENIVAIDLKDLNSIEMVASLPLQAYTAGVLPPKGSYFECIDSGKGVVLDWVLVERENMDCYALH